MEQFEFNYPAKRRAPNRAHVGVVGSGDLELLLEPNDGKTASVRVRTSVDGFKNTWKTVLDRFFNQYDGAIHLEINAAVATPGTVPLRLQQAVEAREAALSHRFLKNTSSGAGLANRTRVTPPTV